LPQNGWTVSIAEQVNQTTGRCSSLLHWLKGGSWMVEKPNIETFARIEFEAEALLSQHPPVFDNERKRVLFEKISQPIKGKMSVSRWRGNLPDFVRSQRRPHLEMRQDIFSYPVGDIDSTAWHVNFADSNLFGYYGGPLFAQDEHQVMEHPILGSLREALLDLQSSRPELAPRTRDGSPTPYLIKGAQRSLSFDTMRGPYGNSFASASLEHILASTTFLASPAYSNILAMVAPLGGSGRYSLHEITDILRTAFIGFAACKAESTTPKVVIHTGTWGCGAYGGNHTLMMLLQLCAAQLAGIDHMVFHTVSRQYSDRYEQAVQLFDELSKAAQLGPKDIAGRICTMGFEWGRSDGN
jgi:hypothetical protein